jgi:glycerol kinase
MAGLVMGIWPDQQALQAMVTESRRLYPQMKPEDASALYQGWLETIGQA